MAVKVILAIVYLAVVFYLGYKGWRETREASDYMLAGRRMNPFVMAMSYGATFISTSAIIGFGGAAAMFGFSLLWLTFLNIAVGIFLAMVFLGKRTRRMGVSLDAHTFPELLGRRYQSRFVQGFSGLVVFLFVPVYAAAVLISVSRIIEVNLGVNYNVAIIGFTVILAFYVITGGLKAVMYTDAFQGSLMFIMMAILVVFTYAKLGGVVDAHQALTDLAPKMPESLKAGGMLGWTQGATPFSPLWLVIYTTIVYGVGIGVLAQPQLAVRFMTVSSDRDLHRAVLYGGVFILAMTGVAYVVGSLSNVIFFREGGKLAIQAAGGNMDKIIPVYISQVMPGWFGVLFLLAMLAAAMSTLSSQYHVGGTSLGRDFYDRGLNASSGTRGRHDPDRGGSHRGDNPDLGALSADIHRGPGHRLLLRALRGRVFAGLSSGSLLEGHDPGRGRMVHAGRFWCILFLPGFRASKGSQGPGALQVGFRGGHPGRICRKGKRRMADAVCGPQYNRPAGVVYPGGGGQPAHAQGRGVPPEYLLETSVILNAIPFGTDPRGLEV